MSFAPKPAYRPWDRAQQIGIMLDEPFNFGKTVGENFLQGVMDSYGLGTAIRDAMTPQGNLGERFDASGRGRPMFDPFNMLESDQISMTPDEYQSSKYYRKDVPWDHGLTEDRAAALAEFSDTRAMRAHYSEKQPVAAFLGQLVGQAFDPINYIPVFGEAAQAAAIAKAGSVGGRMLLGASEAAINTAAFGVLTADIRGKLGDDVSFASIVNEVATSALIGGVFGGGIGVLSRGGDVRRRLAEAKVRDGLDSMATTQRAMIPLGEAATSLADTGVAKLSVNGMSTIERMRAESATRDVTGRALETETAGVTGNKAGEVVISPSGFKVNVRPEVVDISTLTPATGALQVRNRNSAASAAQVEQIATGLEPARLMPAIAADQGAPLVGDDNIIDSGNGRVLALRRAYEAYPEKAAAYRAALTEAGYDVTGIANPVLISRRVTPLSPDARAQFNADANSSSTARMSAVEIAEMDRAALNDGVLNALDDGPIAAPANRAFVARFLGELPPNERGALVDKAGNLNADGVRRLENALVASAYGDVDADVLRRFAEATDDNTRAIVGAMSDVAGPWARMRRAIRTGEVDPEFDTTPELTQALRMLGGWRDQAAREGRPVSVVIREGMAQMDLLGGAITPEAQIFVRMFYQTDAFAKAVGRETLAARLNRVINSTLELGKPQLFGDALPVTKGEVLKNATNDLETDLFAPDSVERGAEGIGQGGERSSAGANREGDRPGAGENAGGAEAVLTKMRERFVAAGRPDDEAEAAATLISEFYSTQAQRLGRSVDDMVEQFGLPEVRQGDVAGDALFQSAPAVDTPEFRAWFGDSKVVDAQGKPLVVYHGTNANFDAFDPARLGEATGAASAEMGFFFAADPGVASSYADLTSPYDEGFIGLINKLTKGGYAKVNEAIAGAFGKTSMPQTANVMPVYLRIENPMEVDYNGKEYRDQTYAEVIAKAKAAGHDGVILRNTVDEGFNEGGNGVTDIFVAFEPTQIKSQFNRGTFDPADPRILFQPAYHGTPHIFDKFDSSKIGTGEGAQAFGHGLYFAGRKGVAEYYRDALSGSSVTFPDGAGQQIRTAGDVEEFAIKLGEEIDRLGIDGRPSTDAAKRYEFHQNGADALIEAIDNSDLSKGGDVLSAARKWLNNMIETRADELEKTYVSAVDAKSAVTVYRDALAVLDDLEKAGLKFNKGRLFKVDIPTDDELLVWDAPLEEQPPTVLEKIKSFGLDLDELADDLFGGKAEDLTGEMVYEAIANKVAPLGDGSGNPAAASRALAEVGIPGHRYADAQSRNPAGSGAKDDGTFNYVIYDDSRVNVIDFEQKSRGAIQFGDDGSIISLFANADASTALHETGHHFLSMFKSMAERPDAPAAIKADWDTVKGWWSDNAEAVAADAPSTVTPDEVRAVLETGTTGDRVKDLAVNVGLQEQWARGFESYLRDGVAPSEGLRGVFEQFKRWLTAIYKKATDLNVNVSPELRAVFDRMLRADVDMVAERITDAADLIATQPARTLDELYAVAPAHQEVLGKVGAELGERYGAEWKDPGIKDKAGAAEKMTRKRYDSTRRLTDVVRGGFVVKGPEAADAIIADLGKRFTVVDEGWRITAAGYFDRKAMVQFEDGTIGEVQFWHPDMLDAKKSGHDLYEEMRKLPDGDPRYEALLLEQREIYLKTLDTAGDEWLPVISQLSDELVALGRPASGKAASNADSVKTVPESTTSSNRTDSQAPPSETMAQAELPLNTAGRDSQSMNVSAMRGNMDTPPTVVNTTEPAPDPVPEGLDAAEARVGRPDSVKELAEQFGVDEAGGYVEQGDIDRLRALGRLSPEEEAALKAADDAYADAESYAETLNYIAATCGVRG